MKKTHPPKNVTLDKPKVLILVSTGVDATKVDGTAIYSAFQIPVGNFVKSLPGLTDTMKSSLRNKSS